jgi:hypothetical protein
MPVQEWKFGTKKEALAKMATLKKPEAYVIVKNRENGKFIKGWTLKKQ